MPRDPKSRDGATLADIQGAALRVVQFIEGFERATFLADLKTQSAVLHQLLLIGEATNRLSSELRAKHPHVPWVEMIGMRNRLIHGYDDVDLHAVWKTAVEDMPLLLRSLNDLLKRGV